MNENERNEQWRERIRAYRESGLTMRAWCAAQGIPFNQLKYWLRKLSPGTRKSPTTTWVTVTPTPPSSAETSPLVVRIGSASIDIRPGFDASLLTQVVRVLEAGR